MNKPLFSRAWKRGALIFALCATLVAAPAATHFYFHSNLSSSARLSAAAGAANENLESAVATVNERQSAFYEAARAARLDARALGAAVIAQRALQRKPLVSDFAEYVGSSPNVGLTQVCVGSTEAALRIAFTPDAADSALYYGAEAERGEAYSALRSLLWEWRNERGEALRELLRVDARANALALALIVKQSLVRARKDAAFAASRGESDAALGSLGDDAPRLIAALCHETAFAPRSVEDPITPSAESLAFARIAALLYARADVLP